METVFVSYKVWIVPGEIVIYENQDKAVIEKAELKVMLEEDYVAQQANGVGATRWVAQIAPMVACRHNGKIDSQGLSRP